MTTSERGRFELAPTVGRTANTWAWAVLAVAGAGIGVFGIATGLEHWWGALLAWAAAAFLAVAAVRVHRCTIAADEHGITVVNPLVSYHIDWVDLLGAPSPSLLHWASRTGTSFAFIRLAALSTRRSQLGA